MEILRRIPLPCGAEPYTSIQTLVDELWKLIRGCVSIKDNYASPLIAFILASWVIDRLKVAPYLSVVGLTQSGKTTLLRVLRLVCRRALLTADLTSAAFYQACDQLTPTLLIDDADTLDDPRKLYRLLRIGTTRDVVALRKNRGFDTYGLRAFVSQKPSNDLALNSRCVQLVMVEANDLRLADVEDEDIERLASKLRAQLLRFRFEHYSKVRIKKLPDEDRLRPRSRDLLRSLAAPCAEYPQLFEDLTQSSCDSEVLSREALPAPESAVLAALFSEIHQQSYSGFVKYLTEKVNEILKENKERFRLQFRGVGAILTSFGVSPRRRKNLGYVIGLNQADQEIIHRLVADHEIDLRLDRFLRIDPEDCHLCQKRPRP